MEDHQKLFEFYRTRYGWSFEGPFYTQVPEPKKEYIEREEDSASRLKFQLTETFIVKDHFQDHSLRRQFWDRPSLEVKQVDPQQIIREHTKVRGKHLLATIYSMENISSRLNKSNPSLSAHLNTLITPEIREELSRFREMSFDDKVAYAKKLDAVAYTFLEVLSK